jgi:hypothetical protein
MLDLGVKINLSLQAVAQLLVVIGAGTWLAKRHGFGKKSIAAVASVNWHACIPALLFSSIVAAIDAQRLATLWPLLVFSLLHVVIGAVVSLGLGLVTRLPRDLLFYTVMAGCVPNSGNLPWLVLPLIVRQLPVQGTADSNVVYTTGEVLQQRPGLADWGTHWLGDSGPRDSSCCWFVGDVSTVCTAIDKAAAAELRHLLPLGHEGHTRPLPSRLAPCPSILCMCRRGL